MKNKQTTASDTENKVIKRLIEETRRIKGGLFGTICFAVLIIACNLYTPKLLSEIIDKINSFWLAKNEGIIIEGFLDSLIEPICMLLGLYTLSAAGYYFKMLLLNNSVSKFFTCAIRIDMSNKLVKVPVRFIDNTKTGEVLSRMTNDVSVMGNSVHSVVDVLVMGILQIIGIAVMMFVVNWQLALVVIAFIPFSVFLSSKLAGKSERYFHALHENYGEMYSVIEETYGGFSSVKAYNLEQRQLTQHEKLNLKIKASGNKAIFLSSIVQAIITFTNNISYVIVCLLGGYLSIKGLVSIGAVVAIILYAKQFSSPLELIADGLSNMQRVKTCAGRVYALLDEGEMSVIKGELPEKIEGNVEFKDVCFGYNVDVPVIKNLNLKVNKGETVAIVGPTGAGKTTIVNLLMRFYDVDSGVITLDNLDISSVSRESVRDKFAMVLQDTWLRGGTIFDNVAYGKDDATFEEVQKACDMAYCDHYIRTLPNGYYTEIGEDSKAISGGQKQLLTIARAFLANKSLLILDEATSNVDTRTELLIQKAMDKLMRDKTCFVIAHRLSTIVDANTILVLNGGKIVEMGTHKELLEKKGFYYEMYNSQYIA